MASTEQHSTPPTVPPSSETTTTAPVNPPVTEPRESHERPTSASSHSTDDAKDTEKQQPQQADDDMPSAQKVQSNADSIYPPGREVAVVMIALLLAMFLIALDRTIITTAIPQMTDEFHSLDDIGWYGR